jgi:hypothetical protein
MMPVNRLIKEILKGSVEQVLFGCLGHPEKIRTPQGGKFPVYEIGKAQRLIARRIGHREKPVEIVNGTPVSVKVTAGPQGPEGAEVGGAAAQRPLGPGVRCRPFLLEEVCEPRQVRIEKGTSDDGAFPQITGNLGNPGGRFTGPCDGRVNEQYHGGNLNTKASDPCFSPQET